MNVLNSWIDVQAAAQAARDLSPSPASLSGEFATLVQNSSTAAPLRAEDFSLMDQLASGREPKAEDLSRVRQALEKIRDKAETTGLLRGYNDPAKLPAGFHPPQIAGSTLPEASPEPKPQHGPPLPRRAVSFFTPPLGPLATRIRAFADWLKTQIAAEEFFILDGHGCPVTDAPKDPEVTTSALILAEASRRASRHLSQPNEGALHMDLPGGKRLCVIHTETIYGGYCLAIVGQDPPPPASTDRLRRALKRTIESEGGAAPIQKIN